MEWSFVFFLNSVLLGVGLAMDAFSVSMANGLHDPKMNKGTMCKIAGTFGIERRTVYKDINAAIQPLTALFFGIDAVKAA